jgi:hypothetical protein
MGLTGRISPHTFFIFCENRELSPWQPYHASRGFQSDNSCVTVGSVFIESQTQHFYGGMIMTWTAPGVLDRIVEDLIKTERLDLLRWWRNASPYSRLPLSQAGKSRLSCHRKICICSSLAVYRAPLFLSAITVWLPITAQRS